MRATKPRRRRYIGRRRALMIDDRLAVWLAVIDGEGALSCRIARSSDLHSIVNDPDHQFVINKHMPKVRLAVCSFMITPLLFQVSTPMRIVVQRVKSASVTVDGTVISSIGVSKIAVLKEKRR